MIRVTLDKGKIDWLREKRIYFGAQGNDILRAGTDLLFERNLRVEPYVCFTGTRELMQMGSFSYINSNPGIRAIREIGRYCSIATGVTVPRPRHPLEWISTSTFTHQNNREPVSSYISDSGIDWNVSPAAQKESIKIGNDVWIGMNVMLMPGITIGDGAVLAAGAVVTRDVPPYQIIGGNPAKIIRSRFPCELVTKLCKIAWWQYDFRQFAGMNLSDPACFVEEFEKRGEANFHRYEPQCIAMQEICLA